VRNLALRQELAVLVDDHPFAVEGKPRIVKKSFRDFDASTRLHWVNEHLANDASTVCHAGLPNCLGSLYSKMNFLLLSGFSDAFI
jgi:hypothetical protein